MTDTENEFIIRANEPLAALLQGATAHGKEEEKESKSETVPPESEDGTRAEEEKQVLRNRVTNLRLNQVKIKK